MPRFILALLVCLPLAAQADPAETNAEGLPYETPGRGVVDHDAIRARALALLEQEFAAFRDAAARLSAAATAHCDAGAPRKDVEAAFRAAYLAWAPLDSYQFGPVEARAAALTVNFWPDKKNFVGRAMKALLAEPPARQRDPAAIAQHSVAAQGLPAVERLLYDDLPTCPAAIGVSAYLAGFAAQLHEDWFAPGGWAAIARAAGPDNPVYLSAAEFTRTLYTAVDFGLTRIAVSRIGHPLGDRPGGLPNRAEAWRSGLSAAIMRAQLDGVARMIERGFDGDIFEPDRNWVLRVIDQARDRIDRLGAPVRAAVADPEARVRLEALQTKIFYLKLQLAQEVGPGLGVDTGFSAADGD